MTRGELGASLKVYLSASLRGENKREIMMALEITISNDER